jgi:DNA-binding PadR family transcriptional regulator
LILLAEQPLHGYQIIQEIGRRSGGIWRPSPGSVYPALQQLEDEGLVWAEQREGRRVYDLTDDGRAYVAAHQPELAAPWDAMTDNIDEEMAELHDLTGQLAAAAAQVAHAGTAAQIAEAQRVLASTRRALYRILAQGDAAESEPDGVTPNRS